MGKIGVYTTSMPFSSRVDRSQLSGETLQFMQRLWDVMHGLNVRSKRMARQLGVTGPQRFVIRVLGQSPNSTASDVAGMLGLHPSTMTGILKRLEHQGMIERKADPDDRRRARFRLTNRGSNVDRERKATVEAAVRRSLARADRATVQKTTEMLEILASELARDD